MTKQSVVMWFIRADNGVYLAAARTMRSAVMQARRRGALGGLEVNQVTYPHAWKADMKA